LAERKLAWEERQESVRLDDQQATLRALKAERLSLALVQSQVLQNVAVRLDLAFQAFFRRMQAGETPGYPRFRRTGRYGSRPFRKYLSAVGWLSTGISTPPGISRDWGDGLWLRPLAPA
jgi:putative transposase